MKTIRKINLILLFVLTLFVSITSIDVFASENSYSNFGATYTVKEVTDERDLGYGVRFHRELSTLTTNIASDNSILLKCASFNLTNCSSVLSIFSDTLYTGVIMQYPSNAFSSAIIIISF